MNTPLYKSVMIIDDTFTDRYIAEHYLKHYAVTNKIISQESATEALTYLSSNADSLDELPQIILLDIRMPGMDGFEFLREYEKLPAQIHAHCTIFMVSSSIDPEDQERARKSRFVKRFINKPITKESLEDL